MRPLSKSTPNSLSFASQKCYFLTYLICFHYTQTWWDEIDWSAIMIDFLLWTITQRYISCFSYGKINFPGYLGIFLSCVDITTVIVVVLIQSSPDRIRRKKSLLGKYLFPIVDFTTLPSSADCSCLETQLTSSSVFSHWILNVSGVVLYLVDPSSWCHFLSPPTLLRLEGSLFFATDMIFE